MDLVSVTEASKMKGCSGQAVRDAVRGGLLDVRVVGRTFAVLCNEKWREWLANPRRQVAARASWASRKSNNGSGSTKAEKAWRGVEEGYQSWHRYE